MHLQLCDLTRKNGSFIDIKSLFRQRDEHNSYFALICKRSARIMGNTTRRSNGCGNIHYAYLNSFKKEIASPKVTQLSPLYKVGGGEGREGGKTPMYYIEEKNMCA